MKSSVIVIFSILLLCPSALSAQDVRTKEFGPLFDGNESSYDKLIKDGFTNDTEKPGPIMIQGDHGQVDVRNIRIFTIPVKN